MLIGELRNAQQGVFDLVHLCRDHAAGAFKELHRFDGADEFLSINVGKRRDAESDILKDFNKDAAETEHNHRTHLRIGGDAGDKFALALDHFLNDDAFKTFKQPLGLEFGKQILIFGAQLCFVGNADTHPAHIRLVRGGFGRHFHDYWVAHAGGELNGFCFAVSHAAAAGAHAAGVKYFEGFARCEFAAALSGSCFEDRERTIFVHRALRHHAFRTSLPEALLVEAAESFCCFFRIHIEGYGDLHFGELLEEFALGHEDADDGLFRMISADSHQFTGNIDVFEAKERQVNHHHHVDIRVGQNRFDRTAVVFQRGRGDHVDGIFHRSGCRQEGTQFRLCFVTDRGHLHAEFTDRIGRHDAGTAGIGDDRHAVALRNWAVGEHFGGGEEVFERHFADDAGLL